MAKKQDTISIGFEEKIWKAADILRGNLSASQYEGVVLGLIFSEIHQRPLRTEVPGAAGRRIRRPGR